MTKKFLLVTAILWMMVITTNGQKKGGTPEERAKKQTEMIKEATGIDAAKAAKVEAISLKYAKEMVTLREKFTDKEARKEPMKALNGKEQAELKAVLTADEFAKWTAAKAKGSKKGKGGGGGGQ